MQGMRAACARVPNEAAWWRTYGWVARVVIHVGGGQHMHVLGASMAGVCDAVFTRRGRRSDHRTKATE
jgi:hypothetical protein